jgi:hypothetical protein
MNGGDDETRTRDLCRDSGLQVLSTTWKSTDGTASHWKYIIGNVIVYRHVHRGCSVNRTDRAVNFRFARRSFTIQLTI